MSIFLSIPILGLLIVVQSTIISRIPLLHGTADLVLLALLAWALQERVKTAWHWAVVGGVLFSLVSALPFGVPLVGYLLVIGMALIMRRRVWHVPFLAMMIATFFGTLITHGLNYLALRINGAAIPWQTALNLFTLPSVLLNLLFAVPAYAILADLASWLYPEELEV